jgi:hypothetical protein
MEVIRVCIRVSFIADRSRRSYLSGKERLDRVELIGILGGCFPIRLSGRFLFRAPLTLLLFLVPMPSGYLLLDVVR